MSNEILGHKVSDYLGDWSDFNSAVLNEWVEGYFVHQQELTWSKTAETFQPVVLDNMIKALREGEEKVCTLPLSVISAQNTFEAKEDNTNSQKYSQFID